MAAIFDFVVHVYHQLVLFVADNTAFVIVIGILSFALAATDEVRLYRRNHTRR